MTAGPCAPTTGDDVRSRIVQAAARLLHEHGRSAVTTRAVAQAAGVQAPTIYRQFGDKDGLLEAVVEQAMETYVAAKAPIADGEARRDGDPVEDLRNGWRLHVEFGLANPELFALLNDPGRVRRSAATAAGVEILRSRVHRLAAAGLLRVDEDRATAMIHAAGTGAVLAMLASPPAERDLTLADAMFDALARAILTDSPAHAFAGDTSTVVAFGTVVPTLPGLTEAERTLLSQWVARALAALQA